MKVSTTYHHAVKLKNNRGPKTIGVRPRFQLTAISVIRRLGALATCRHRCVHRRRPCSRHRWQ